MGADRPLDVSVAFACADVVLERSDQANELLLVQSYPSSTEADGISLSVRQWDALLDSQQALSLTSPVSAQVDIKAWLFGPDFPALDQTITDLRAANAYADDFVESSVRIVLVRAKRAVLIRAQLASTAFDQAWRCCLAQEFPRAQFHAERAFEVGGVSPETLAMLAIIFDRLGEKTRSEGFLSMASNLGAQYGELTRLKCSEYQYSLATARPLSAATVASPPPVPSVPSHTATVAPIPGPFPIGRRNQALPRDSTADPVGNQRRIGARVVAAGAIAFGLLAVLLISPLSAALFSLASAVVTFPAARHETLLLSSRVFCTVLVYFMQFGFIAFEAGAVRESYRLQSAVKNLVVFVVSFVSYVFVGRFIVFGINDLALNGPLDIAFHAGFATTASLIVANAITERGTFLANSVCAIAVAGIGYPTLAGLMFENGPLMARGFLDTAGGCVVHILGGTFALVAAWKIGPRSRTQAWAFLDKPRRRYQRPIIPLSVVGALFLWFGWLGFNAGNTHNEFEFQHAFLNTCLGACAGCLMAVVAMLVAARFAARERVGSERESSWTKYAREVADMERIVIGMMGGLVAVTANASVVEPAWATVEAAAGGLLAVAGSAWLSRLGKGIDDPLGAIFTHAGAGLVGTLLTPFLIDPTLKVLYPDLSFPTQLVGCLVAVVVAGGLSWLFLSAFWLLERNRYVDRSLLRLTSYHQATGLRGVEASLPQSEVRWALETVGVSEIYSPVPIRAVRGDASQGSNANEPLVALDNVAHDPNWIQAIGLLALSDNLSQQELNFLIAAIDSALKRREGGSDERAALAAMAVIGESFGVSELIDHLDSVVERARYHWEPRDGAFRSSRDEWMKLDTTYRSALVWVLAELTELLAARYEIDSSGAASPQLLHSMRASFYRAHIMLREIEESKTYDVQGRAGQSLRNLRLWPFREIRTQTEERSAAQG